MSFINNSFFILLSFSITGSLSGGILHIICKDIYNNCVNKKKSINTPINMYNLFNFGGYLGLILGVTRWYVEMPVLNYFLVI